MTEKLWALMHLRSTGEMLEAINILADLDDRTLQGEVRHLIRLGLEQERERVRRLQWPRSRWITVKKFFQFFGEAWEGRR